jgi:hypothetical protein
LASVKDPPEVRTVDVKCRRKCRDEHDAGDKDGASCDHERQDSDRRLNGT